MSISPRPGPGLRLLHRHPGPVPLAVALAVVALTGVATTAAPPARSASPAARAVDGSTAAASLTAARSLADGVPGTGIVPTEVVTALGYVPARDHGLAANGDGDCSSPVPLPAEFEPACRVHDLGYDLLRLAHAGDAPIPRTLRGDLDSLLSRQMHDSCGDSRPCHVAADIAHVAVHVNTVRQGHGAPVEERLPW